MNKESNQTIYLGHPEEQDELSTSAYYLCPAFHRMNAGDFREHDSPPLSLAPGQEQAAGALVHAAFAGASDADWTRWRERLAHCQAAGECRAQHEPPGFEKTPNQTDYCDCREIQALVASLADPKTRDHTLARIGAYRARQDAKGQLLEEKRSAARVREVTEELRALGMEPVIPLPAVARGSYLVIRADGTETTVLTRPSVAELRRALGCKWLCAVTLSRRADAAPEVIMNIDDTGLLDRKPVNARATELVRQARGQEHPEIYGDVALVNDADFGED
jgi:hypothetical protein